MFDCGPAATLKLVKVGLSPIQVDYLFFTHHHFDHHVDYPCFLLCRWDQSLGRENALRVYGPTLTETLTERLLGENGAFVLDTSVGSIIFTGDTQPYQTVVDLVRGADLMLCMCSEKENVLDATGVNFAQCGTVSATRMAAEAGVKKLVLAHLGHHLTRPDPMAQSMSEMRQAYGGEIVSADELTTLILGR